MESTSLVGRSSARELAAATPPDRERYVDLLRAASIAVVVLGHWLIAVVVWRNGEASGSNALAEIPRLWIATWILQVMPVFFFVGGFSNMISYDRVRRRGGGYAGWLDGRLRRLLRPTLVFVVIWVAVATALRLAGLSTRWLKPMSQVVAQPLWFIGIYLLAVALAPFMRSRHAKRGVAVLMELAAAAAVVDILRFTFDVRWIGYANFAFVWLFAHQLGFLYADGTLRRLSKRRLSLLALGGVAVLTTLITFGPYPGSMVGLPGDRVSNMNPPTLPIIALALWQIGLVMLMRDRAARWLTHIRPWAAVISANAVIMTLFLWHLSAMLLAIAILYPIGFPQPHAGTTAWWLLRPVWITFLAAALAPLVLLFGRFEQGGGGRRTVPSDGVGRAAVSAIAAGLLAFGLLGFAVGGFAPGGSGTLIAITMDPLRSAVALAAGLLTLRLARRIPGTHVARGLPDEETVVRKGQ